MRTSWSEAEGRAAIEEWRSSGETLKAYSARVGVGESKLHYWRTRVNTEREAQHTSRKPRRRSTTPGATFLPVVLRNEEMSAQAEVRGAPGRDEDDHARRGLIDPEWVARLVRALFVAEGVR